MKLKPGWASATSSRARDYQRRRGRGRGRMEVRTERSGMVPIPPKKGRHHFDGGNDHLFRRQPPSPPMQSDRRTDRYSPPATSMRYTQPIQIEPPLCMTASPDYSLMTMSEKLNILREVSSNLIVVSECEGNEVMQIINALTQSLLLYKIRVLPPQLHDTLTRHIITGDNQGLENTLSVGGAGMSSVGTVMNSMAADPFLQTSGGMGLGNMGGGADSSESAMGLWGPTGAGARMPSPGRMGYRSESNPTSQWQGGRFRGSDRSSLGY